MSAFATNGPAEKFFRAGVRGGLPRVGYDATLDAPGIVAAPPAAFSGGLELANELARGFGLAGNAAQVVTQGIVNQERAALGERREAKAAQEGMGVQVGQEKAPEVFAGIDESADILSAEDVGTRADELVDAATDGLEGPALTAAQEYLKPRVLSSLFQRQAALKKQAQGEASEAILRRSAIIDTGERFNETVDALVAVNPGLSRENAAARVGERMVAFAAEQGDQGQFDKALAIAGDVEPIFLATQRNELNRAVAAKAGQINQQFDDRFGALLVEARDNKRSLTSVEQDIRGEFEGKISSERLNIALNHIDAEKRSLQLQNVRLADLQAKRVNIQNVESAVALAAVDPSATLSSIPDEVEFTLPGTGDVQTVKTSSIIPVVIDRAFAQIDDAVPIAPEMPPDQKVRAVATRISRKADYLAIQGPKAVYEPWKNEMSAVKDQSRNAKTASEIPPAAVEAFTLFRSLEASGTPAVVERHAGDSADFMRTASLLATHGRDSLGRQLSASSALHLAARAKLAPVPGPDTTKAEAFAEAADDLADELGFTNTAQAARSLAEKASIYAGASGNAIDSEAIVDRVKEDFRQDYAVADGRSFYARGAPYSDQLDNIAKATKTLVSEESAFEYDHFAGLATIRGPLGDEIPDAPVLTRNDIRLLANVARTRKVSEQILFKSVSSAERAAVLGRARKEPPGLSDDGKRVFERLVIEDRDTSIKGVFGGVEGSRRFNPGE